jgi:hypothetical protein
LGKTLFDVMHALFEQFADVSDVPKGTLLYYNRHAAKILDRKTEYIGSDVRSHHKKAASNEKLDLMLQEFKKGRMEPFRY